MNFKNANELRADYFALLFGIGNACKLIEEAIGRIDISKVGFELVAEDLHHLLVEGVVIASAYRHRIPTEPPFYTAAQSHLLHLLTVFLFLGVVFKLEERAEFLYVE